MPQKFGSNDTQLATTGGAVTADNGSTLISGDSQGSAGILFGPASLREIQARVANGDFAIMPNDPFATITDDNPLPYWSGTSVGSSVTAAIVESLATASGNTIVFSTSATPSINTSYAISRYVPITGNAARGQSYQAEAFYTVPTGTVADKAKVTATIAITAYDSAFNALTATSTSTFYDSTYSNYSIKTKWTTPDAKAAFFLLTLKVAIGASAPSAATTIPFTEVRLNYATAQVAFPNATDPTLSTWLIGSQSPAGSPTVSQLSITNQNDTTGTLPSIALARGTTSGSISINANDGGEIDITAGVGGSIITNSDTTTFGNSSPLSGGVFNVNMNGSSGGIGSVNINGTTSIIGTTTVTATTTGDGVINAGTIKSGSSTTSDLLLQANGADVIVQDTNASDGTNPRIIFKPRTGAEYAALKSGAVGVMQVLSGTATTTYGQLWAARIYPMNGSTASRYIYDDGTNTRFTGPIYGNSTVYGATGVQSGTTVTVGTNLILGGVILDDTPTGTTQTSSAAIWVLISGTNYELRRNTSSARYKTNIVDADAAVLSAARKIKPRHYESTIPEEAGATRLGFIAEEVETAGLTHAVGYDAEGRVDTIDPTALIAALFARVNDLEERLKALESR